MEKNDFDVLSQAVVDTPNISIYGHEFSNCCYKYIRLIKQRGTWDRKIQFSNDLKTWIDYEG